MRAEEFVEAWGHRKIKGSHRSTLEITKEPHLTERGDCIVAVRATKGASELSEEFKLACRNSKARIVMTIEADGLTETVKGQGSERLQYAHPTSLVARRSGYICGRTLMINSDKAACDLSRELIRLIQNPRQKIEVALTAEA